VFVDLTQTTRWDLSVNALTDSKAQSSTALMGSKVNVSCALLVPQDQVMRRNVLKSSARHIAPTIRTAIVKRDTSVIFSGRSHLDRTRVNAAGVMSESGPKLAPSNAHASTALSTQLAILIALVVLGFLAKCLGTTERTMVTALLAWLEHGPLLVKTLAP
jgi:hypothetical protein